MLAGPVLGRVGGFGVPGSGPGWLGRLGQCGEFPESGKDLGE
jgi:hypothetical protein